MYRKTTMIGTAVVLGLCLPISARASLPPAIPYERLAIAPAADLTLTFSFQVDVARSRFEVFDDNRRRVPFSGMEVTDDGLNVLLPITTRLPPGNYTMKWHAFSRDGQFERGSYTFTVNP